MIPQNDYAPAPGEKEEEIQSRRNALPHPMGVKPSVVADCWSEFNVEIQKDRWNRDGRMAKDFEFRTDDEKRDLPLAMTLAYEFAAAHKWQKIEVRIKRLDDPNAENLLPTIDDVSKSLLANDERMRADG